MGRHAGFLTASSALLKKRDEDGYHLIFIPEVAFSITKFLDRIKKFYNKYGKCKKLQYQKVFKIKTINLFHKK